jgi:hypothetical protein
MRPHLAEVTAEIRQAIEEASAPDPAQRIAIVNEVVAKVRTRADPYRAPRPASLRMESPTTSDGDRLFGAISYLAQLREPSDPLIEAFLGDAHFVRATHAAIRCLQQVAARLEGHEMPGPAIRWTPIAEVTYAHQQAV